MCYRKRILKSKDIHFIEIWILKSKDTRFKGRFPSSRSLDLLGKVERRVVFKGVFLYSGLSTWVERSAEFENPTACKKEKNPG